jgi:hypothetical protein
MGNDIYHLITFPEREWKEIAKSLKERGICSSIRCCQELGRYKVGEVYATPWGDLIKITSVRRYTKLEDIPTRSYFDKEMMISLKKGEEYGIDQWDYLTFERIGKDNCDNRIIR